MTTHLKNIVVLALIAFSFSIQVWLISIFVIPHASPVNLLAQTVFPEWMYMVHPKEDAFYFHFFVFAALAVTAIVFWMFHRNLTDRLFIQKAKLFLALEIVWTFLLLSAAFKIIVYAKQPQLAMHLFLIVAIISVASKIFFKPIRIFLQQAYHYLHSSSNRLAHWAEIFFPVLIVLILYVPDAQGVMARDFMGEQFHHWDSSVMAPGWASISGCVLNVDVISQYGLGLPIFIAHSAKFFGGFSYENVFRVMLWGAILYYLGWYFILRTWLKSPAIAAAGILFAIKIQMFHAGAYPIIFTYPSNTIFRNILDVVFFALMLGHLKSRRAIYLWVASAVCGVAVFYMTTTGISMSLTWFAYLASLAVFPDLRKEFIPNSKAWLSIAIAPLMIFIVAFGCFWLAEGQHLFTAEFWHNMQEFNNYFLSGFGEVPLQQNILDHNYLPMLMGLLIPLVYMGTMLMVAGLYCYRKLSTENLLACYMAVYGLVMYHYFMARPSGTSAYSLGLPYAFLLAYWLKASLEPIQKQKRRDIILACLSVAAYALVTNYNFVSYPNVLNLSRNPLVDPLVVNPLPDGRSYFNHLFSQLPMEARLPVNSLGETDEKLRTEKDFATDEDLRRFYAREFDFSQDARLIDELVPPGGKVALVSSFEVKVLMDADRAPFFYYTTPLVVSRMMRMRTMVTTNLFTKGQVQRCIDQMEMMKPEYIFIERIFGKEDMALVNYNDGSGFLTLMRNIHAHYEKYRDGHFLMALKRKTSGADEN